MATTKETALDRYMLHIARAQAALEKIAEALDDHLGYAPDEISWGHVTVAHDLAEALEAAHQMIPHAKG